MNTDDRYTRITLRIPKELHAQLVTAADETSKSTNAEIIARLEESFAPKTDAESLEGRIAAIELKSMATELSLSAAVFQLLQQMPKQDEEVEGMAKTMSQEMLDRIAAYGDIQARFDELIKKLPIQATEKGPISFEYRPDTTPTAKKPTRKGSRPLGVDPEK